MPLYADMTLAQMKRNETRVLLVCSYCKVSQPMQLDALIAALGDDACLWDRRPKCQSPDCRGRRHYMASPGSNVIFRALKTDYTPAGERFRVLREELGLTDSDWYRIKGAAPKVSMLQSPFTLNDLDAPWKVGMVLAEARPYFSGRQIGIYSGRAILIWPK